MIGSKVLAFAGGVAMLSTMSLAWTISGTVVTEAGVGIPQVVINSFNYAGNETQSDAFGNFVLSNDGIAALQQDLSRQVSVHYTGKVLTMDGLNAQTLKVSLMDALGKVVYSKEFREMRGNLSLDMSKYAGQRATFLRISSDGSSSTYMLTDKGALLKEGDPMAMLMFAKAGYENVNYTMQAEVEAGVVIVMKAATALSSAASSSSNNPFGPGYGFGRSSSSVVAGSSSSAITSSNPGPSQQSSSSVAPASSGNDTQATVTVDCSGKSVQSGKDETVKLTVKGSAGQREFIMHVPSAYKGDKPVPLVIDYHPIGGSGSGQMGSTTYKAQTDPEGVISLYPQGTTKTMGPGWNVGPCCSNDDDLEFTREMIKYVREKACIDPQRIYATGFSMGGGMSNHVACMMSDVFAAVAPAAMDLNKTNSAQCTKARPISVINFRGTADNVCRYQGGDSGFNDGLNFLGAEGTFKYWAEADGCTGSPTTNSDGCQEYSNCKDGVKVVLCTKQNGGHEQGNGKIGWPFLKQFTLPASFVK